MALGYWLYVSLLLLVLLVLAIYVFFKRKFTYWQKLGVPTVGEPTIPHGNFKGFRSTKPLSLINADLYKASKDEKVVGTYAFMNPVLLVRDLDIVKDMLVKDFGNFHDRGFEMDTSREPLAGHLFLMSGQKWRNMRVKLTPAFTTGKMRMMFTTIIEVGKRLTGVFEECAKLPEVEVKDICARYTTDVIALCAFGVEADSLKYPDCEFRQMARELMEPKLKQKIAAVVLTIFPNAMKYLPFAIKIIPHSIEQFFIGLVRNAMEYRVKNNEKRNDFLQLLLQIRQMGYIKDVDNPQEDERRSETLKEFTYEEAAAQAFVFYFAGSETSSATMQFLLYELAVNPELQVIAQSEVDRVRKKFGNAITYDALQEMELLDRILSETLRKYPVADVVIRESIQEYNIPGTNITLPPKTKITFPLYGIHHDENYYPNPDKFDPDRFLPEERAMRHPFSYLPFGEGPRSCIGNRFGLMQIKTGVAVILSDFTVSPSKNTPIPMVLDPKADILLPKGLMPLKISRRVNEK